MAHRNHELRFYPPLMSHFIRSAQKTPSLIFYKRLTSTKFFDIRGLSKPFGRVKNLIFKSMCVLFEVMGILSQRSETLPAQEGFSGSRMPFLRRRELFIARNALRGPAIRMNCDLNKT
jgi:hypothetical protein